MQLPGLGFGAYANVRNALPTARHSLSSDFATFPVSVSHSVHSGMILGMFISSFMSRGLSLWIQGLQGKVDEIEALPRAQNSDFLVRVAALQTPRAG